jgi:hypothetical protein
MAPTIGTAGDVETVSHLSDPSTGDCGDQYVHRTQGQTFVHRPEGEPGMTHVRPDLSGDAESCRGAGLLATHTWQLRDQSRTT